MKNLLRRSLLLFLPLLAPMVSFDNTALAAPTIAEDTKVNEAPAKGVYVYLGQCDAMTGAWVDARFDGLPDCRIVIEHVDVLIHNTIGVRLHTGLHGEVAGQHKVGTAFKLRHIEQTDQLDGNLHYMWGLVNRRLDEHADLTSQPTGILLYDVLARLHEHISVLRTALDILGTTSTAVPLLC